MTKDEIKNLLTETASVCKKKRGWIHLSEFAVALKAKGFDFRKTGHFKLSHFLSSFPDMILIKEDDDFDPPLTLIHVLNEYVRTPTPVIESPKTKTPKVENAAKSRPSLLQWAWMGDFKYTLRVLSEFALPEQWYYGHTRRTDYYPILGNYLIYTFFRLQKENKVRECEDYAAFNTGLVDKKYKQIFALFQKTNNYTQNWEFKYFCVAGEEWSGKTLVANFKPLPARANYFREVADMIYDTTSGEPSIDDKHIFIENTDRLPYTFIEDNCPKGFTLKDTSKMEFEERKEYFKALGSAIEADEKTYRYMKARLDDAVKLALKRIDWNFKTAIPMYYPNKNKMSLLLPLALVNDDKVDVALVVERTPSGNYLGHTILPLSWAYSNARLVTRPDSDWLVAEEIDTGTEEDDTEN
jgi:hypothetical protein